MLSEAWADLSGASAFFPGDQSHAPAFERDFAKSRGLLVPFKTSMASGLTKRRPTGPGLTKTSTARCRTSVSGSDIVKGCCGHEAARTSLDLDAYYSIHFAECVRLTLNTPYNCRYGSRGVKMGMDTTSSPPKMIITVKGESSGECSQDSSEDVPPYPGDVASASVSAPASEQSEQEPAFDSTAPVPESTTGSADLEPESEGGPAQQDTGKSTANCLSSSTDDRAQDNASLFSLIVANVPVTNAESENLFDERTRVASLLRELREDHEWLYTQTRGVTSGSVDWERSTTARLGSVFDHYNSPLQENAHASPTSSASLSGTSPALPYGLASGSASTPLSTSAATTSTASTSATTTAMASGSAPSPPPPALLSATDASNIVMLGYQLSPSPSASPNPEKDSEESRRRRRNRLSLFIPFLPFPSSSTSSANRNEEVKDTYTVIHSTSNSPSERVPQPNGNVLLRKPRVALYHPLPSSRACSPSEGRLGGGTVRFEDGEIEEGIDHVYLATGYTYSYPFLPGHIMRSGVPPAPPLQVGALPTQSSLQSESPQPPPPPPPPADDKPKGEAGLWNTSYSVHHLARHLWPIPLSEGRLPYPPETLPFLALPSRVSPLPLVHAQARAALGLFTSSLSRSSPSPTSLQDPAREAPRPLLDLEAERRKIRERYEELGGYEKWHVFREGREQFDYREEMYRDFLPPPPPPPPPLSPPASPPQSSGSRREGEGEGKGDGEEDPYAHERTTPPSHRTLYELKGPCDRLGGWDGEKGGYRKGEDAREAERAWVELSFIIAVAAATSFTVRERADAARIGASMFVIDSEWKFEVGFHSRLAYRSSSPLTLDPQGSLSPTLRYSLALSALAQYSLSLAAALVLGAQPSISPPHQVQVQLASRADSEPPENRASSSRYGHSFQLIIVEFEGEDYRLTAMYTNGSRIQTRDTEAKIQAREQLR
ncbi:hypothetical protein NMY22_g18027 [Coprinellus aureogranulatus]|nr:hypothetical protein NMY22_g18027 [Coprinellus aureogranulatus]